MNINFFLKKNDKANKGFTLLELLVVLAIISILGVLAVQNFIGRIDEARITAAQTDIKTLSSALQTYKIDNARFPTTEQGLDALASRPSTEPAPKRWKKYIDKVPADPWGNEYQYLYPGTDGRDFDVFSYGPNGQPGGEGDDADIGNW